MPTSRPCSSRCCARRARRRGTSAARWSCRSRGSLRADGAAGAGAGLRCHAGGGAIPAVARERVLAALPAAGIPFEPVVSGGAVAAIRFVHTWVEAYVAYGNYRGAGPGTGAKSWVALDPSLPGGTKYVAEPPAQDALAATGLSRRRPHRRLPRRGATTSPLAFVRDQRGGRPCGLGRSYEASSGPSSSAGEPLGLVPGSLPYVVRPSTTRPRSCRTSSSTACASSVSDAAGALVETGAAAPPTASATGPSSPGSPPRTATRTPCRRRGAVQGRGVCGAARPGAARGRKVRGCDRHALGRPGRPDLLEARPPPARRLVPHRREPVVAGNVVAIGLGGPGTPTSSRRGHAGWPTAPRRGSSTVARRSTRPAGPRRGGARAAAPGRPDPSDRVIVLVESQLAVDEVLGVRRRVVWKGLQVDADHRSMDPLELVAGRGRALLRLSGFQGS